MDKSTKTALLLMLLKIGDQKGASFRFWVRGRLYYTASTDPGGSISAPPDPAVSSGNAFLGWFTEQNGGREVEFPIVPVEDGQYQIFAQFENDIAEAALDVEFPESGGVALVASYPEGYDGSYFELSGDGMLEGVTPAGTAEAEFEIVGNELYVTI